MFRFLRRVFILLVLFIIIFLVFRFVKPEATNRFVDRIKSVPTTISGRFHREKKSNIKINWDTTYSSWNFEINGGDSTDNDNYDYNTNNENYDINTDSSNYLDTNISEQWTYDSERLEELNREIEAILASWNSEEWIIGDKENELTIIEIEREEWDNSAEKLEFIELEPGAIEQPESAWNLGEIIWEVLNESSTNTQQNTSTQTTSTNKTNTRTSTNTTSPKQQCWACSAEGEWKCLSVQDCEDLARDFSTYN